MDDDATPAPPGVVQPQATPFSWTWARVGPGVMQLTLFTVLGPLVFAMSDEDSDTFDEHRRGVRGGLVLPTGPLMPTGPNGHQPSN